MPAALPLRIQQRQMQILDEALEDWAAERLHTRRKSSLLFMVAKGVEMVEGTRMLWADIWDDIDSERPTDFDELADTYLPLFRRSAELAERMSTIAAQGAEYLDPGALRSMEQAAAKARALYDRAASALERLRRADPPDHQAIDQSLEQFRRGEAVDLEDLLREAQG